jgi:molybdate transport system substrate-binding protein
MRNAALVAAQVLALAVVASTGAGAAEVKVLASTAIKTALEDLAPQFEKATEHRLRITYGASGRLGPQIQNGEPFDLAIVSTAVADALAKAGKIDSATRINVAKSGAGVAVRKGAPRLDVSTTEGFKRAVIETKSLGYSETGATGQFLMKMFDRLGITEQMKPKLVISSPARPTLVALAEGEVEMTLPQIGEALVAPGIDLLGPLPQEVQTYTVLPAAVSASAKEPEAAKALLKFLTSPAAATAYKARGLEPVGPLGVQ